MDIEKIIKEREEKEQELQIKYNSLNNYTDKLKYIYKILETSQKHYLKWKNRNFFTNDYLKLLKNEIKKVNSDDSFVDFINENLVNKINNDHVSIGPLEYEDLENELEETTQQGNIKFCEDFKNSNVEITFVKDSAIIKIKSFRRDFISTDKYIFDNLELYLKDQDVNNIIIDIRDNGGGSDAYFKHFSCFTNENLQFHDRLYDLFIQKELDFAWTPIPKGSSKFYNKYLLINQNVFSTAETLAKFCKQTGYATIIGEATLGEGGGFTPFKIQLTTGIYNGKLSEKYKNEWKIIGKNMGMHFPTEAPINVKGEIQYNGYFNTVPDIKCKSEEALKIALDKIYDNLMSFKE